jgi:ComF family protein
VGRADIEAVACLLYFRKKGMVQRMMHVLKYKGREDIGKYLGLMLGREMRTSGRFDSAELIVPVPLHPKRKRSRGYNQSAEFGRRLADSLGVPFLENVLIRKASGSSQTRKSRIARNRDLRYSFEIKRSKYLIDKHVILADDIITSGSTMEICARKVLEGGAARVSLASMAFTL